MNMLKNNNENNVKRTILIVEDNEINREMLKLILEEDYNILEANDGIEGLNILRENFRILSLVLLDVQMPRMNGYEFLETVSHDAFLSNVPIIVTTGSTISEDEEKCLSLGASDFITKPYNPKVMIKRIEAIIRLHEATDTLEAIEFDPISGLYTKSAFFHHVESIFTQNNETTYDMLMIDIEDFAYFNEKYGIYAGNALLKHIGNKIKSCAAEAIYSTRLESDKFVLIKRHSACDSKKECILFDEAMHEGTKFNNFTLKYAEYESVPTDIPISVLCDRLILAIKSIAHQYNEMLVIYDDAMSEKFNRTKLIEASMKSSLKNGDFKVYYQPKHDTLTGKICGAEALVRWIHPEYGFMSPGEFIPVFEANGFISGVDLYVWEKVCENIDSWIKNDITPIPVSVNGSRRDFLIEDSLEKILKPVEKFGIDKDLLHIEVTESLSVSSDKVLSKIKLMRDAGFKIELDDFGSGESSLGTIDDIPMDVIKLDISFVREIERKQKVVKMIIALAHELGLKTIAEGVETKEQLDVLRELGCDAVQGYYYSKPLPENEFREYLIKTR